MKRCSILVAIFLLIVALFVVANAEDAKEKLYDGYYFIGQDKDFEAGSYSVSAKKTDENAYPLALLIIFDSVENYNKMMSLGQESLDGDGEVRIRLEDGYVLWVSGDVGLDLSIEKLK